MDEKLAELRKQNRTLRESRGAKLAVRETLMVLVASAGSAAATIAEAVREGRNPKFKVAKVGQADKNNANDRVYPRVEWQRQINRVNETDGKDGLMLGAVDHLGCAEGGNLKSSPIIWRGLEMAADGGVFGEFEVVKDHTDGKNLLALIESGARIGFSTFGYARAHRPTETEAKQFGIDYVSPDDVSDDQYEGPVVIEGWELVKIDSVDNPAVRDARLVRDDMNGGRARLKDIEKTKMKTLQDLKDQHPVLFALHEAAVKAVQDKVDAQFSIDTKYRSIVKRLGDSLACLAKEHGAEVPLKDGVEVSKELADKIVELEKQLSDARKETQDVIQDVQAEIGEKAELQKKLDAIAIERTQLQRRADVTTKTVELLKESKFAAIVQKAIDAQIADAKFDLPALEALVKARLADCEEVARLIPAPPAPLPGPAAPRVEAKRVDGVATGVQGNPFAESDDDLIEDAKDRSFKPLAMFATA